MTDDPDALLREVLRFRPEDLAANRRGHLSPGQRVLLSAGRSAMHLSFAVFATVMAASALGLGLTLAPENGPAVIWLLPLGALAVVGLGWAISRPYLGAPARPMTTVTGIVAEDPDPAVLRIGTARLRLGAAGVAAAFVPGLRYRVHYLDGPVPLVLSAEWLDREGPEAPAPAGPDPRLATLRRGRALVLVLGAVTVALILAATLAPAALTAAGPWPLIAGGVAFAIAAALWLRR